MPNAIFSCIVILQSLKPGERRTGRELYDDLDSAIGEEVTIIFNNVHSKEDFIDKFEAMIVTAEGGGFIPLLHIEAHGARQGIEFTDGSTITWSEVKPYFRRLNKATENNLIVVSAMCFGMSQLGTINLGDTSPCWAIIAPPYEVLPDDVYAGFYNFYTTFFNTKSANKALAKLLEYDGEFGVTYSAQFVKDSVEAYLVNCCTSREMKQRALSIYNRLGKTVPIGKCRKLLESHSAIWTLIKAHEFFSTEHGEQNYGRFKGDIDEICNMTREHFPGFTLTSSMKDLERAKRQYSKIGEMINN